jgi:hypothetical protein
VVTRNLRVVVSGILLLWVSQPESLFSHTEARILARNAPRIADVPDRCVRINENRWSDQRIALFSVYDNCRENSVSRLVGPYFVDLRTGEVRVGAPANDPEESSHLKQVRESILRKRAAAKSGKAKTK